MSVRFSQSFNQQASIAVLLSTTQPRVSTLRKGEINDFRLDMLIGLTTRLGVSFSINIAA